MKNFIGSGRAKPTSRERLKRDLRAVRILDSRIAGQTLAAIAAAEAISISRVAQIIEHQLSSRKSGALADLRRLEAERLDALQAAVWQKAMRGNLNAVTTALSIMSRRAKLLGLDASPPAQDDDWKAEWIAESETSAASVEAKLYAMHERLLEEEKAAEAKVIEAVPHVPLTGDDPFASANGVDDYIPGDEIYGERPYR